MRIKRIVLLVVLFGLWFISTAQAFYNPTTGKWLSRDPIAEHGGINLTRFIDNNPVQFVDEDGRQIPAEVIVQTAPRFVPRVLPDPVPTGYPRLSPPIPITPPQNINPQLNDSDPNPNDPFPPLNTSKNAPKKCPKKCPDERLRELSNQVNEWKAKRKILGWCGDDDDRIALLEKIKILQEEINARTQRERECWEGGDQGHVWWIEELKRQLEKCRKLYPNALNKA